MEKARANGRVMIEKLQQGLPDKKPAKDSLSSSSDQHTLESEEDIQALMDEVAGEDGDLGGEELEEDEILADLEKEYERLDWLPFYDEINVNKLCLLYKCLNGQCPEYLGSRLVRVSDLSTRTSCYGAITIRCPRYNHDTEGGKNVSYYSCKTLETLYLLIYDLAPVLTHSNRSFVLL